MQEKDCILVDDIVVGRYVFYDENGKKNLSYYSLFKYHNDTPNNDMETGTFIDLVSGAEFIPTNHYSNNKTPHKTMVDGNLKYGLLQFDKLQSIVQQLGLTKDDYIDRKTLLDIHEILCPIMDRQMERPYYRDDEDSELA